MGNEINKKTENTGVKKVPLFKRPFVQSIVLIIIIFGALAGFTYWQLTKNVVSIENAHLDSPIANISASTPGILNALYVKEGSRITANSPVALVGSETVYAKEPGLVSHAPRVLGSYFTPGQSVVSVVDDQQMRVVGAVDETEGLDRIIVGQRATFTVDTFGSKTYSGHVSEIAVVSDNTGIVFSISDKRPVERFNIYISFDPSNYPELKTGMSAKIKVYTNS